MKPEHLGDYLDFYKRGFLAKFFGGGRLALVPMLTEPWTVMWPLYRLAAASTSPACSSTE
jgi:hypothetical protein